MLRRPPRSTRTDTLFPYTTLFRSTECAAAHGSDGSSWPSLLPDHGPSASLGSKLKVISFQRSYCAIGSFRGEQRRTARSALRSEEHTSELQSLMRTSYAVFCLQKKTNIIYKEIM